MSLQPPKPSTPAHAGGVRKGESRAKPLAQRTTRLAQDASGINPESRHPIHPKMPHLPPA